MTYDIIIIGAGPAGLTAAIYAGRARMKTAVVSDMIPGGQAMLTDEIENYPGFSDAVKGPDLMNSMFEQAKKAGSDFKKVRAEGIAVSDGVFTVRTASGNIEGMSLIIATGASYETLGVKGEKEFTGRGVSYCGVCDAPLFRNKEIAVVGGGDTAVYEACHLLKFCGRLHMIHRRDRLRATKIMQDALLNNPKTVMHWNSVLKEIRGDKLVKGIQISNVKTGIDEEIPLNGVFVFVGVKPESGVVGSAANLSEKGYIITNESMETSVNGIFACGDVRKKMLRQISTAVGEGAQAAFAAQLYVEGKKGTAYV
ncbi:MAG: thioredoxin-disulfide reductase [Candidatus Omnitrophota bacterium]